METMLYLITILLFLVDQLVTGLKILMGGSISALGVLTTVSILGDVATTQAKIMEEPVIVILGEKNSLSLSREIQKIEPAKFSIIQIIRTLGLIIISGTSLQEILMEMARQNLCGQVQQKRLALLVMEMANLPAKSTITQIIGTLGQILCG